MWWGVLLLTFVVHGSYINNGFVWLDHGDIEQERAVLPIGKLGEAFVSRFGQTGFYRPAVTVLNSMDRAAWGKWAIGWHLTNVMLHVAATAAVMAFWRQWMEWSEKEMAVGGLVFGLHPISWLPVGAISYRPELMATALTFAALYWYGKTRRTGKWGDGVVAVLAGVGALLAKESAVVWLGGGLLLWEVTVGRNLNSGKWVRWMEAGVFGLYAVMRLGVGGGGRWGDRGWGWGAELETRVTALGRLVGQLISPTLPGLSDAMRIGWGWEAVILVIAAAGLGWWAAARREMRHLVLWLGIFLLPATNIVYVPRFVSPHYAYAAVAVISAMLVVAIRTLRGYWMKAGIVGLGLWLVVAGIVTWRGGFRYRDDISLFGPEVERDENFLEGRFYLGGIYWQKGQLTAARQEYETILRPDVNYVAYVDRWSTEINLAGVEMGLGEVEAAEKRLVELEKSAPENLRQQIEYNLLVVQKYKQVLDEDR